MANGRRYAPEDVQNLFKDVGYKVLGCESKNGYVLTQSYVEYKCEEGHVGRIRFSNFLCGIRCKECQRLGQYKFMEKDVKNIFYADGYKLLKWECNKEGYIAVNSYVKYRCPMGHEANIQLKSFQEGKRCKECCIIERQYAPKDVQSLFEDEGYKVTKLECENGYVATNSYVEYICKRGHEERITLNSFQQGHRCKKCQYIDKQKYTTANVQNLFRDREYEIIEWTCNNEYYIRIDSYIKYKCSRGHETEIQLRSFLLGHGCRKCAIEGMSGKNSYRYNFDLTDEEREIGRNCPEYRKWIKDVYKKDNYTCQKCKRRGGKLNAHHIYPYSIFKLLRTNINNGVTFCGSCHNNFHYQYGNDCNYSQLIEFLNGE